MTPATTRNDPQPCPLVAPDFRWLRPLFLTPRNRPATMHFSTKRNHAATGLQQGATARNHARNHDPATAATAPYGRGKTVAPPSRARFQAQSEPTAAPAPLRWRCTTPSRSNPENNPTTINTSAVMPQTTTSAHHPPAPRRAARPGRRPRHPPRPKNRARVKCGAVRSLAVGKKRARSGAVFSRGGGRVIRAEGSFEVEFLFLSLMLNGHKVPSYWTLLHNADAMLAFWLTVG